MTKRKTALGRQKLRWILALLMGGMGLWVFGLTGALDSISLRLSTLGTSPTAVVSSFPLSLEYHLYGLLPSSALLSAGQELVFERMSTSTPLQLLPSTPEPQISSDEPIYAQGDDDGGDIPDLPTVEAEDVVNYTATGDDSGNYLWVDPFYVANRSMQHLSQTAVQTLMERDDYTIPEGGIILIIHTHGTEAYTPVGEDSYVESDPYRTTNNQQNIVRVGEEMASLLREAGYIVLHDTNLYDYPDYSSSYSNSRIAVEAWMTQYPDIALILDVHRDALTTLDGDPYRLVSEEVDGAQFMLVVGTDDSATHPLWEENFSLALQLQEQLTDDWGTLCRPTTLRSSRYNQDLSTNFLLVEVGGHGNSLQDALLGAQHFTQSLITSLSPSEVTP